MGAALCKAEVNELETCYGRDAHCEADMWSLCRIHDDVQDGYEERARSYSYQPFLIEVRIDEPAYYSDLKVSPARFANTLRWDAQGESVIGDTPVLPESFLDEEDGDESTLVHANSDIARALKDNGDGNYEGEVDSAQSNGMGAAVLAVDLDKLERALVHISSDIAQDFQEKGDDNQEGREGSPQSNGMEASVFIVDIDDWEGLSKQNPEAQRTFLWTETAAIHAESAREATEKVAVGTHFGTDDVKQTLNLACLANYVDQTLSPCNISDTTSNSTVLSRRLYVPKVTHFLNSLSTCGENSARKEEQSACLQQICIEKYTKPMDSQLLDGAWMLDDGDLVAVVKGSDVKLLGDGAEFSFQLQELGAGVWAATMDDEEFLADCSEREDGRLLLHWSDGVTWVRKEQSTAVDSASTHQENVQDECQSTSSSCFSSSSSSSSLSSSSPSSSRIAWSPVGPVEVGMISEALEVTAAGEAAKLVPDAEASKASKTIYVEDFEDRACKINDADNAWGACKVEKISQARHPSRADKTGDAVEASKTIDADDMDQHGQFREAPPANVVGDCAVPDQAAGEDITVCKTGEADETSNVSKIVYAHNVNMDGKFNEAVQINEACKAGELIEGKAAETMPP